MPIHFHALLAPLLLAVTRPPAPADTTPGYLQLGFELLRRRLGATPADNVSLSPASAGFALSVAALGARSRPSRRSCGSGFTGRLPGAVAQANQQWIAALSEQKDVQLEIANAIWVDQRFVVDSSTPAGWRRRSRPRLDPPYCGRRPASRRSTAGRPAYSRPDREDLDQPRPNSAAFIANATYFKGTWLKQFAKDATGPKPFYESPGSPRDVPTMHATLDASYARAGTVQLARLPYLGGRFEMVIVLPDSSVPLTRSRPSSPIRSGNIGWIRQGPPSSRSPCPIQARDRHEPAP